jgi:uncharacterized membrane protein YsdA (DUF1294 family)
MKYIYAALAVINIYSFLAMCQDKERSKKSGTERMPEGKMFFLAAALGSFGIYAGMFVFRHKTKKWYFLVGVPLLMLENLVLAYFLYLLLSSVF